MEHSGGPRWVVAGHSCTATSIDEVASSEASPPEAEFERCSSATSVCLSSESVARAPQEVSCGQNTRARDFFSTLSSLCTHHIVTQGVARRVCIKHVHPHVITCLSVCCFLVLSLPLSLVPPLSLSVLPVFCPELQPPWCRERGVLNPIRTRKMRSIAPWRCTTLSQIMEPNQLDNQLDNFDYSETSAAIFQDESVDMDTEPSYSCDAELDDELIGKALSSPLFIQKREEPANLRQTYHSHEECFLPAQSFFTRTSTGRPVYEPSSDLSQKRKSSRDSENENQDSLWKTKRANSCWSQIWDPEARTSSRVW